MRFSQYIDRISVKIFSKMKFKVNMPSAPGFLKSVKYVLGAVNGIFLVTGLFLIIMGTVALLTYSNYENFITKRFFSLPGFVIATGVLILFAAVLGFYGAISEQFYVISGYVVFLGIALVFEISMTIVAYGMQSGAANKIQSTMLESLRLYETRIEVAAMWDDLQREFECCGVGGRFDFISNRIPVSCCRIGPGEIGTFTCTTANAHELGCADALGDLLGYYAFVLAVSALVVACMQVPLTAMAAWMAYRTKFGEVEVAS